jgi:signal transduction histidine kinase
MIGSEIVLDKLQKNLMQTMIDNSGATKGLLVLKKNKEWVVEVEGKQLNEKKISQLSLPLDFDNTSNDRLPLSIIRYVKQTRQNLVIKNVIQEKTFQKDSYILKRKPKSVFCSPIIHQGKLIGIFYLEHNQKEGLFTSGCLDILGLFSAQAAISLENARLYAEQRAVNEQMQREINERKEIEDELLYINEELERSNEELLEAQSQLIQSAKLASIGELATGMAHELNQPLMYIRNSAQLSLMEGPENLEKGSITELLKDIEKNTSSMMGIINHLRDFARHQELNLIPLDIHDILDDSLILINEQLRIRSIKLEKDYGEEIPSILGNSQQLEQVFINILTNARDAMEEQLDARLSIKTSFIQLSEFKGEVTASFIDNGVGILDENHLKIFDPFFTTKEAGKGTGLGLSISYGIIRDHGGRISVENNRQAGATFRIILPIDLREVEPGRHL